MGSADRIIRILVAVVIIGLYMADMVTGIAAIILLVFAGAFIVTSFISTCPLYMPFGLSTLFQKK